MEIGIGAAGMVMLLLAAVLSWYVYRRIVEQNRRLADLENSLAMALKGQDRIEMIIRQEMGGNREEAALLARQGREESLNLFRAFEGAMLNRFGEMASLLKNQLDAHSNQLSGLINSNEYRMDHMRSLIDARLKEMQADNTMKLDQMRVIVDEKLQSTLDRRLGESFQMVAERLDSVQKGLGEMQHLAAGVGDLKKVLSNVKTRGTWGEAQLGAILEDILSPGQYAANVAVKGGRERVEYAVRLPGQDPEMDQVWLPVDAKFPLEDYQRLQDACEAGDSAQMEQSARQLENQIRLQARNIAAKYIDPPNTTDFAIMFLPTEGLYSEVLRRPGLYESIRRDQRILIAGPSTLAALVYSLSMGFRTLAIQKRSHEVWTILNSVKREFGRFSDILDNTLRRLQEASDEIEKARVRSRAVVKELKKVENIPEADGTGIQ